MVKKSKPIPKAQVNRHNKEVDKNYKSFQKLLPKIIETYRDKYALIFKQDIMGYFDTFQDALTAGHLLYGVKTFSIQQVTDVPLYPYHAAEVSFRKDVLFDKAGNEIRYTGYEGKRFLNE